MYRGGGRGEVQKGIMKQSSECPLEVTQHQLTDIQHCEAVVVREYEQADGSRFARPVAWGDASEMQDAVDTPSLFIVPVGFRIVGQRVVPVRDLIG